MISYQTVPLHLFGIVRKAFLAFIFTLCQSMSGTVAKYNLEKALRCKANKTMESEGNVQINMHSFGVYLNISH